MAEASKREKRKSSLSRLFAETIRFLRRKSGMIINPEKARQSNFGVEIF